MSNDPATPQLTPKSLAFVHPSAIVEDMSSIGHGASIWHFCHVRAGASIGHHVSLGQSCYVAPTAILHDGCRVQNNVSIYDGVTLEQGVFVGPSVVFTNVLTPRAHVDRRHAYDRTLVRHGASLGANSTIVCGVTVGAFAMIGAGAVVTRDVPDHARIVGNPAKQVGWSCWCGHALKRSHTHTWACDACARRYLIDDEARRCRPIDPPTEES